MPSRSSRGQILPLLSALEKWPRWSLTIGGLVLIYIVGYIDYLTGIELSPQVLYLVPVGIVAWCVGRGPGCLLALNTAMARLIADQLTIQLTIRGMSLEIVPLTNAASHGAVVLMFAWTLASLRVRLDREASLSRTDELTRVNNFRAFIERADHEIERSRRRGYQFAVVYLDCDNFKQVNDRFGHTKGDELLCLVAETMQNSVRRFDIVARLGGDEFAILLPEVTIEQTTVVTQRVRERLDETVKNHWPVTFSVGAVTFEKSPESVTEMLRVADNVMYCAKRAGKDQICGEIYQGATLPLPSSPVSL
ncbi:MAG TPA: GGDEF domain-containing protein [Abditibacteriaceae bacterium]